MKAVRFGSYSRRSTVAVHVELTTLEVDQAVQALGAAAAETDRDTAIAAATARLGQTFDQRLFRAALVELAAVDQHQAAAAGARSG